VRSFLMPSLFAVHNGSDELGTEDSSELQANHGLSSSDLVVEPSCGAGAFLKAIPDEVPVVGVKIDPELAEIAQQNTGPHVITGDFATATLPSSVTADIGKASAPYGDCSAGRDRSGHRAHNDLRKDLLLLTRATAPAG